MKLPAAFLYLMGTLIATMALSQCTPALAVSTKPIIVEIPLSAKPITTQSLSRYAALAHKSSEQTLAGLNSIGAQPANLAAFLCVPFAYAHSMAWLGGDTERCAGLPMEPVGQPAQVLPPYRLGREVAGLQKLIGAPDHG